jgi:hypothetical protein
VSVEVVMLGGILVVLAFSTMVYFGAETRKQLDRIERKLDECLLIRRRET